MRRPSPQRRRLVLGAALALSALGCNPEAATVPIGSVPTPHYSVSGPGAQTLGPFSIPIAPTNYPSDGQLAEMGTGLKVPSHTAFVVKVSGRVTVSSNPAAEQCFPAWPSPHGSEGSYGPSGGSNFLGVTVGYWGPNGAYGYYGLGPAGSDDVSTDTIYTTAPIEISVKRSGIQGASSGMCNGQLVAHGHYLLSSSQTVSVTILDGQELTLVPSVATVEKGTSVAFTALSRGVKVTTPTHWTFVPDSTPNTTTACGNGGPNPCTVTVNNSGTVRVVTYVQGQWRSASAHVTVITCPTDDPVLNDPEIRRALKKLIQDSGYDLDPGAGIPDGSSLGSKRERAGDIYRRPDGTYYFMEDTQMLSNECIGIRSSMDTRRSPGDVKVGDVHTHPTPQFLPVYGCPPSADGVQFQEGPWDTLRGRKEKQKGPDGELGGGSRTDWDRLRNLPENTGGSGPQVDGYMLNADGEVWKLPTEMMKPGAPFESNRKVWRWWLNRDPKCNW